MPNAFPIWDYLNAIYRHRLIVVCTLFVGLVLTGTIVPSLPDVYTSTTLIMVEPQDVPEAYVKATVTDRLDTRLNAINQEVLSRTRLEGIIKDLNLYPEQRGHAVAMERIVDLMRSKLQIQVFPLNNTFRISYEAQEPRTAQQVTARLAGMYIDENLRIREAHASGTTEFLEGELTKGKRQLEELETGIRSFKQKYMGELPEQRDANMHALEGYRVQLQTVSQALSAAMERKIMLERQAADVRSARASQPSTDSRLPVGSPAARLRQLEADLTDLRSRYTDQHPDVIWTQKQIARLRAELAGGGGGDTTEGVDPSLPPEFGLALAQAAADIKRLKLEEERIQKVIDGYQGRVENGFARDQELKDLTRDYDVTQGKYQHLLDKKLEAQLSQSLERRQKGERFRMLDPASLPQAPTRPNRPMLLAAGAALSLALALGIPILLRQLDSSFHAVEECSQAGLPILAVIPQLQTTDVDRRRWRYRIKVLAVATAALVLGLGAQPLYTKYLF